MTYSEKLKDPRWQRKRLEIMQRDNFSCTSCGDKTKTLHVHHNNGYRNGLEPWDYPASELKTLCEKCHDLKHRPKKIYLAGKIEVNCWRHSIVSELSNIGVQGICGSDIDGDFPTILEKSIFGQHHYTGPFFVPCDHGCFHGNGSHGSSASEWDDLAESEEPPKRIGWNEHHRQFAFDRAMRGIELCDIFFAYITSPDCYGTLFEIGVAHQSNKFVALVFSDMALMEEFWFARKTARYIGYGQEPGEHLAFVVQEL